MRKSEPSTQEWTLATVPAGEPVRVVEVVAASPASLLMHGLRAGARLSVESDAPFGGPRIVRLGQARLAIDRGLAGSIRVAPVRRS